uniref:BEL1-like homeodomain protein 8 n=1 Tax=Tanacetum cinerariifolium TaxID=118510 RepID=A0A6L2JLT8_TANCI|nr:BEL1-like homeodomain protein 8 [Tanacetum cinerariifolium]
MVEEIHTLETKGMTGQNSTNPQSECQDPSRMDISLLSNTQPPECSRNTGVTVDGPTDQLRDHEKLARPEYQIPLSNMDRLMSIMPYPQTTFDATGLGPVSLTLGLRQNAEHVQQLQQHFGVQAGKFE